MTAAMRPRGDGRLRRQLHTGVSGGSPVEHREHVADGEVGHRGARLARRAAQMRREHDVLERQQPRMDPGSFS